MLADEKGEEKMTQFIQFIQAHGAIFTGLGIALIDMLWAVNPSLKANGILHQIFLMLGGKDSPTQ